MHARSQNRAEEETIRVDDVHLVSSARRRVEEHDQLRRYSAGLQIHSRSGHLQLRGRLPSFYLKQMLQTTLRHLPGCESVANDVEVIPPGDR